MRRNKAEAGASPVKHRKERILSSQRFSKLEKDFLYGLLRDDETYTAEEAAELLKKYLKQEAK